MHFDPVGSEHTSSTNIREFAEDDGLARQARDVVSHAERDQEDERDREDERDHDDERAHALDGPGERDASRARAIDDTDDEDDEDDEPAPRVREGLPARFSMRHTPHYVDELLGDAPPRTVREIPLSEIESPIDDRAELDELERSIRRLGVIEPLLVGRRGASYLVIAGMRRLRAAHRIGLGTVPCLVHDVDETRLTDMRDASMQRVTIPLPPQAPAPVEPDPPAPVAPQLAIPEAALGLDFVAALLPAMNVAGNDRLRWGVLTDLAGVELSRTKTIAAAQEILRSGSAIDRASLDPHALIDEVVSAVATDARLRGVRLDRSFSPAGSVEGRAMLNVVGSDEARSIFLDGSRCRTALTGLLQCLLALAPRGGTMLGVHAHITSIRPALIVECLLQETDPELSTEALVRFFDAGWREHPSGMSGGPILAAFAQTARAHGGRVEVKAAAKGCLVTFVVPRLDG